MLPGPWQLIALNLNLTQHISLPVAGEDGFLEAMGLRSSRPRYSIDSGFCDRQKSLNHQQHFPGFACCLYAYPIIDPTPGSWVFILHLSSLIDEACSLGVPTRKFPAFTSDVAASMPGSRFTHKDPPDFPCHAENQIVMRKYAVFTMNSPPILFRAIRFLWLVDEMGAGLRLLRVGVCP
jgi:hypothetical protein